MRAAAVLRTAAQAKPKPMSADHTLYHLQPTGFWKKFRDAVVVNPEISSGLPLPDKNRFPPPASRPEYYATPATAASDVAFNQYSHRDSRRAYPKTSVVTQSELSGLLLASPTIAAVAAPAAEGAQATEVAAAQDVPLTTAIDKLPAGRAFAANGIQTAASDGPQLPPVAPAFNPKGKWVPKHGTVIPTQPYAYFPISGYN